MKRGLSKKTRLSKAEFSQIKKQIEQNVLSRYPELEQTVVMSKTSHGESEKLSSEKLSRKAGEQKRRTGKVPQRDTLKAKLKNLFEQAESKDAFFASLSEAQLELYIRGKTIGVKDLLNDRKHRLKTLGLLAELETCSKRIELDEVQKSSTAKYRKERQTRKEQVKSNASQKETGQTKSAKSKAENKTTGQAKSQTAQTGIQAGTGKQENKSAQTSKETKIIQARVQRKIEMERIRGKQSNSQNQDSSSQKKK